jgi:hypothetical protein
MRSLGRVEPGSARVKVSRIYCAILFCATEKSAVACRKSLSAQFKFDPLSLILIKFGSEKIHGNAFRWAVI